jgi:RNA polymerase sigma-70 factor (ECF subfamily)
MNQPFTLNSENSLFETAFDLASPMVEKGGTDYQSEEKTFCSLTSEVSEKANETATDFELVRRSSRGNITAFEEIYNRHHRRIFSLCMRMTQNMAEAEDLTQEVFIQLFRKLDSFRGDSAFSTWLHRMVVNQVLMHFRKRNVRYERTTDKGEMPEQIVLGTENHHKMKIIDRIALGKAISQLPNGYRTVFVLHDVEGFEHEEIARMLNLSTGTSKSQLHKARLKLRGLLATG